MTKLPLATFRSASLFGAVLVGNFVSGCRAPGETADGTRTLGTGLRPYYLEIVTPEVEATCSSLEETHGVPFGDPQADLGGARTAQLAGGGLVGVRAPMNSAEAIVVRPYLLVNDIEAAVENAVAEGAEVALPPTTIAGRGTFAIYFLGGIEHGLWQLDG